ncbi:MAG: SPOR domain-containing protein [Prevotella sp.]|nr:SPOR domain-containing protein [Prevotella sp.]
MKKYIATLAAICCIAYFGFAQDFINHLQKNERGSGTVSVKQSEDISKLVNGEKKEQKQEGKKPNGGQDNMALKRNEGQQTQSKTPTGRQEQTKERSTLRKQENATTREEEQIDKQRRERERMQREAARAQMIKEAEAVGEPKTSDKKLMSNSKRVTGYRVQVFAGGNTREDRAKANEVGDKLKTQIPGQPIYVHFYSPRWCCRCGNFLNQEEANKMRQRLYKLGYKNACVVKTIITVSRNTKMKSGL